MTEKLLGLRIGGTKQRRSGFVPLINIGLLAGDEGSHMDRLTLVTEKPTFVIKHTPDYILYSLVDGKVKSFDADAPGVLSIALTIPADMQLANGLSPYTLLREAYDLFRSNYMEPVADGRDSFKDTEYDSAIFKSLVDSYPLEKRKGKYVTMQAAGITGVVKVSQYDLEDFFANSQYPEFAQFKEIEVGTNCDEKVSRELRSITIPLPPVKYQVYINNKPTDTYLQYPSDQFEAALPETEDYSYQSMEPITLQDLLDAPNHVIQDKGSTVRLDEGEEKIFCNLRSIARYYRIVFNHNGLDDSLWEKVEDLIRNHEVKIISGTRNITALCMSNEEIPPYEINSLRPYFSPSVVNINGDEYKLTINRTDDKDNREIFLLAIAEKLPKIGYTGTTVNDKFKNKVRKDGEGEKKTDDPNKKAENKDDKDTSKKNTVMWLLILLGLGLVALLIWFFIAMNREDPPVKEEAVKEAIEVSKEAKAPLENVSPVEGAQLPNDNKDKKTEEHAVVDVAPDQHKKPTDGINNPVQEEKNKTVPEVKKETPTAPQNKDSETKENVAPVTPEKQVEKTVQPDNSEDLNEQIMTILADSKLNNGNKLKAVRKIWDVDKNKEIINNSTRNAIESVLDYKKYSKDSKLTSEQKEAIKKLMNEHTSYSSISDVREVSKEIQKIVNGQ